MLEYLAVSSSSGILSHLHSYIPLGFLFALNIEDPKFFFFSFFLSREGMKGGKGKHYFVCYWILTKKDKMNQFSFRCQKY